MEFSVFLFLSQFLISSSWVFLQSYGCSVKDGGGFGSGSINLGGLELSQISNFSKVWGSLEGGPDDAGATFYDPWPIPDGYFMLGSYAQANNKHLFGRVLAGKDCGGNNAVLKPPADYTLVWSSENSNIKKDGDGNGYFWLPTPPDGYIAVGVLVTNSKDKPPLDRIRCVHADLADTAEAATGTQNAWIWGADRISAYGLRPNATGVSAVGVELGTFGVQVGGADTSSSLFCLKNVHNTLSYMPNLTQIKSLVHEYSPLIYFHPDEQYLPSSVNWYFNKGALLYQHGNEANPVSIDSEGLNLPKGGTDDEAYWLDLPASNPAHDEVKRGNLTSAVAYFHVKPMLGATFTDVCLWIFYPFNGAARAKAEFFEHVDLGKLGEHVGDWEHLTLRVSNFDGKLHKVYFSQHNKGMWLDASQIELVPGGNKVAAYASLHGHALYPHPGLVLQGDSKAGIGIRNDAAKSDIVMDTGTKYAVVSADYLSDVVEPPWLNYLRKWGPKVSYDIAKELKVLQKLIPGHLNISHIFPSEVLGEDGPCGPKVKINWRGDEII